MNKVILMGRLTKDPELTFTQSNNTEVCKFTLAVDRRFKSQDGEKQADFINIVSWRKLAEFTSKYFSKGQKVVIVGNIQSRYWEDKDGKNHYAVEVIADEAYFAESKKSNDDYTPISKPTTTQPKAETKNDDPDVYDLDGDDDGLPF